MSGDDLWKNKQNINDLIDNIFKDDDKNVLDITKDLADFNMTCTTATETFEITEEKVPIKQNSSCTNASSKSMTYYPEPRASIISPNTPPHIVLDRSYDPMDSISNIGSFYPSLPNRSQSHSPQPTTTTKHKKDKNVNNQSYKRSNRLLTPFSHRNKYHHSHQYRSLKSKYRKNKKKYKRKRRHPHMDYEDDIYDDEMYGYTTSSSHTSQMSVSSYESNRSDSKRRKIKAVKAPTTPNISNNFNAGSINSQTIESGGMNIQFVKNLNLDSANIIGLDSNKINKQNDNNNNNNIVIIINNHFQILK
eukprot:224988_1